jgi:hypothetical protein
MRNACSHDSPNPFLRSSSFRDRPASAAASASADMLIISPSSSCGGVCVTTARSRTSESCALMKPSSGVAGSVPNFVSGVGRDEDVLDRQSDLRRARLGVGFGLGHARDVAHEPRAEPLHDEAIERVLVDACGEVDERLDFAIGSPVEVEVVREAHDRAFARVVRLVRDEGQRAVVVEGESIV